MIKIKNITKSFYKQKIIDDLSLSIKDGSVFGFLGPNGAGKTTTIKMIVGLLSPDSGTIEIENLLPSQKSAREIIGFMPEDPYFYDHLTGLEFLKFCGSLFASSRRKDNSYYEKLLQKVGILEAKNNMIRQYSKGMKQRLGLAQALVNDPKYLFLDEPLDGLDPIGRREIKEIILDLKKLKKTIFFNSHILSDVEEICDQIGIIFKGNLLFTGDTKKFSPKQGLLEDTFVKLIKNQK